MDLKKDILELCQKVSPLISKVSKYSDITRYIKTVEDNGDRIKERARAITEHLHKLADAFYLHLEKVLKNILERKKALLEYHALEVRHYVTHFTTLHNTAEYYLEKNNMYIATYGLQLKADLECCLEQAIELDSIDYETFISLQLEDNLKEWVKVSLCNIVNINKFNEEKQVLESLNLDNLLEFHDSPTGVKECQNDLQSNNYSQHYSKTINSNIISKNPETNLSHICIKTENQDESDASNLWNISVTKSDDEKKNMANFGHKSDESKIEKPKIYYCRDLETKNNSVSTLHEHQPETTIKKENIKQENITATDTAKPADRYSLEARAVSLSLANKADTNKNASANVSCSEKNNMSVKDMHPPWHPNLSKFSSKQTLEVDVVTQNLSALKVTPQITNRPASATRHVSLSSNKGFQDGSDTSKMSFSKKESFTSYSSKGNALTMKFNLASVMRTSSCTANEINANLIGVINGKNGVLLDHPTGLTVDSNGRLIVADTGNNMVQVIKDKHLLFSIGSKDGIEFRRPSAVVTDTLGNIYVKDDRCIRMFDCRGSCLQTIGKGEFQFPYGLALSRSDEDNVLVLIDVNKRIPSVYHYSINQNMLTSHRYEPLIQYGGPTSKVRFLATYNDVMLASDLGSSCMYLSTLKGRSLNNFGSHGYLAGNFNEPSGVTVDAVGNWIIGDSKNNRLEVYNNEGHFLAHIKLFTNIRRPSGIHLTSDGLLYVINYLDSEVLIFNLQQ